MAPKPSLAELRQDAKMESAVEAREEAKLMQAYPKSMPEQSASSILRDAMDAVKSTIASEGRPVSPGPAPPRSSKDVDAMSDGSFEKVEEDVVMVTEADYDLAEKVATQHKNEEDSAALELAGQTTDDFTFLAEASHLDVQKSLAELEDAISKLSTKDTEETKVNPVPDLGQPKAAKGRGAFLRTPLWLLTAPHMAPTRSRTRRRTGLWFQVTPGASCGTSPLGSSMTWCPFSRKPPRSLSPPSTASWRSTPCRWWSSNIPTFWRQTTSRSEMLRSCTSWTPGQNFLSTSALLVRRRGSTRPWRASAWAVDKLRRPCRPWKQLVFNSRLMGCFGVWRRAPKDQCGSRRKDKVSPRSSSKHSRRRLPSMRGTWSLRSLWHVWSQSPYSDSVPPGQRLTLRETVTTNDLLDAQLQGLELGSRPPVRSDFKDGQQALFFHPQAAKALRLQVQLKEAPPAEKETVEQKMAKEEASLQTIAAMQEGAHEVPQSEARGAAVLRHLDMGKFERYLKRKYEWPESSRDTWSQISMAQTSLAEAKESNRKFQEERRGRTFALKPLPDINLWTPRVQDILQSGSLCEAQLDYLMESDIRAAQSACLDLKKLIKDQGSPSAFGAASGARSGPPWRSHPGHRKQSRDNWHSLEKCTRPYGPEGDFHEFCRFTEEELADQVKLGRRPAEDTIIKMFWAPGEEGWHWHRGVTTWNFAALVQRLAHAATLKEIYGIWPQMPLAAQLPSRGQKNKEKVHAELRDFKGPWKRPAPSAKSWASNPWGSWMLTHSGRFAARWGNSSLPKLSSRTALR